MLGFPAPLTAIPVELPLKPSPSTQPSQHMDDVDRINATQFRNSDLAITTLSSGDQGIIPLACPFGGFWVDQENLNAFGIESSSSGGSLPLGPFPYSRLATYLSGPPNSSTVTVYHQFNATMIVEETWDSVVAGWSSSNITISTG